MALGNRSRRKPSRQKIGRPTKKEALSRQLELLDAAVDLFLDRGYDDTTMEQIASTVGMAKRTIYSQHKDKAALFLATVQRALDHVTEDQAQTLDALEAEALDQVLVEVAHMRIRQVTSDIGVKLQRLISAETRRFPEVFQIASAQVTNPVVSFLTHRLDREVDKETIITSDPEMAATAFLSMAAGSSARLATLGNKTEDSDADERIIFVVDLFLTGLRWRCSPDISRRG